MKAIKSVRLFFPLNGQRNQKIFARLLAHGLDKGTMAREQKRTAGPGHTSFLGLFALAVQLFALQWHWQMQISVKRQIR